MVGQMAADAAVEKVVEWKAEGRGAGMEMATRAMAVDAMGLAKTAVVASKAAAQSVMVAGRAGSPTRPHTGQTSERAAIGIRRRRSTLPSALQRKSTALWL